MGTMLPYEWRENYDEWGVAYNEKERKKIDREEKKKEAEKKRYLKQLRINETAIGILLDQRGNGVHTYEREKVGDYLILLARYEIPPYSLKSCGGFVYLIFKGITFEQLQAQQIIYTEFRQNPKLHTPIAFIEYSEKSIDFIQAFKKSQINL